MSEVKARFEELRKMLPSNVSLLAVAKGQKKESILEAVEAGVTLIGNNYVQEGVRLRAELAGKPVEWHFIGHIQSRKARELLDYQVVQSLDRISVAQDLNERLSALSRKLRILVEVNIGEEKNKSGVLSHDFPAFLAELKKFSHLEVSGLMGMPPPLANQEERRPFFKKIHEIYKRHGNDFPFSILSMGTSEDFQVAAQEGSTMVRLGTALFGPRQKLW